MQIEGWGGDFDRRVEHDDATVTESVTVASDNRATSLQKAQTMQIEQIDRDAAADFIAWQTEAASRWTTRTGNDLTFFHPEMPNAIRRGVWDSHDVVQAFARHRLAALSARPDDGAVERVAIAIREEIVRQHRDDERNKCPAGRAWYEDEVAPWLIARAAIAALGGE